MAICTILEQKIDNRRKGEDCEFNGYLEDFLNLDTDNLHPILREAFTNIQNNEPNTKICVGLRSEVKKEAISNQIIRYKDIFKLNGKPLIFPYILYLAQEDKERALLVVPPVDYGFIYAKGMYYCMTEPGSELIDCKNEIVAICSDSPAKIEETFNNLFKMKAGGLQRMLDRESFSDYNELKTAALTASEKQKAEASAVLLALTDRTPQIYQYVVNWFLLKKVLYVQYMVNKNILNTVHDGNVKRQRNQAKNNADEITFLSYSEMWRLSDTPAEETEEKEEVTAGQE